MLRRKTNTAMRAKNRLTVGKLMVSGRMMKGMTLNTVFMARRLGLSIPDSAPNCRERHIKRDTFQSVATGCKLSAAWVPDLQDEEHGSCDGQRQNVERICCRQVRKPEHASGL